jgi:hypothetical protein
LSSKLPAWSLLQPEPTSKLPLHRPWLRLPFPLPALKLQCVSQLSLRQSHPEASEAESKDTARSLLTADLVMRAVAMKLRRGARELGRRHVGTKTQL